VERDAHCHGVVVGVQIFERIGCRHLDQVAR
jgi:hypothetical protein